MAESSTQSKKLQWKWVGISFLMYLVLYLLPLLILGKAFGINNQTLVGVWVFGGVIIVAAVAGYLSKGVTIWEPAIAGAGLVLLFVVFHLFRRPTYSISGEIAPLVIAMSIVFLLSLLGAWWGERAQNLWKTKTPESS